MAMVPHTAKMDRKVVRVGLEPAMVTIAWGRQYGQIIPYKNVMSIMLWEWMDLIVESSLARERQRERVEISIVLYSITT